MNQKRKMKILMIIIMMKFSKLIIYYNENTFYKKFIKKVKRETQIRVVVEE